MHWRYRKIKFKRDSIVMGYLEIDFSNGALPKPAGTNARDVFRPVFLGSSASKKGRAAVGTFFQATGGVRSVEPAKKIVEDTGWAIRHGRSRQWLGFHVFCGGNLVGNPWLG